MGETRPFHHQTTDSAPAPNHRFFPREADKRRLGLVTSSIMQLKITSSSSPMVEGSGRVTLPWQVVRALLPKLSYPRPLDPIYEGLEPRPFPASNEMGPRGLRLPHVIYFTMVENRTSGWLHQSKGLMLPDVIFFTMVKLAFLSYLFHHDGEVNLPHFGGL